jgi:hypothetical protein
MTAPFPPSLPETSTAPSEQGSRSGAPDSSGRDTAQADLLTASLAQLDLFDLGRRATAARDTRVGRRATFARSRQLLPDGTWRGPRDAAEAFVECADLTALGGPAAAAAAGATLLVGDARALRAAGDAAAAARLRLLARLPFQRQEQGHLRRDRIAELQQVAEALPLWGVMPAPIGEAEGLDTLRVIALARLELAMVAHVVLDVPSLGPRLAQMALEFGGDELWGPIVAERALRLGANAHNPALTRKEAVALIRAAGLVACERLGPDHCEEIGP